MSDEVEAKESEQEEPLTSADDVRKTFPEMVSFAAELCEAVIERELAEEKEAKLRKQLLEMWEQMPNLHGIRLGSGTAVRRTWSTKSTPIEPGKLREVLADAPDYIAEKVDMTKLKAAYPGIWRQMGKVKSTRTITVREPKKEGA